MKIAHVNLAKGFRGGERQTIILIKEIARDGLEQVLVCRTDSPMRKELESTKGLTFVSANNQLLGHFSLGHVDIIHAHDAKGVHWAYLYKLLRKVPYLITRRINVPIRDGFSNKLTYAASSAVVGVSESIGKLLINHTCSSVHLVPDSVSGDFLNSDFSIAVREKYADYFIVGHAGALVDSDKGQKIIISAARILKERYPTIIFFMFGSGRDEYELKLLSSDMESIYWFGFKKNILDYLGSLDIFVFPSRNEGLGSILLDVMKLNVPIVATNVGGIPDIIKDHKTGLLIQPNSPKALAEAIEALYLDADLRKKLVSGAEEFVKNYSPEVMAGKYLSLYKKVIGMV